MQKPCRRIVFLCAAILLFSACDNIPDDVNTGGDDIPVRRVLVSPKTAEVQQGLTRQFTAQVEGYDNAVPGQSVLWSILGRHREDTAIDTTGLLTTSAEEEKNTILNIRAVSSADTTKFGTATVTVTGAPAIESIEVLPNPAMAANRLPCQFAVIVTASGDIAKTVLWTIEGAHKPDTKISETGYLTIAEDEEPGAVLAVKAASTADPLKFGTAEVSIVLMADPLPTLAGTRWLWASWPRTLTFDTEDHLIFDNYSEKPNGAIYDDWYTYDPETGTGTVWGGYPAGDFILINENRNMLFPSYKTYGHGAIFDRIEDMEEE
jgi:hypothetical protein